MRTNNFSSVTFSKKLIRVGTTFSLLHSSILCTDREISSVSLVTISVCNAKGHKGKNLSIMGNTEGNLIICPVALLFIDNAPSIIYYVIEWRTCVDTISNSNDTIA
jgi:hypothetical protein